MGGRILAGGAVLMGAMLAASFAWAGQEHIDGFRDECEKEVYHPPLRCDCIANEIATRLSDNQQALVYAIVIYDQAEVDRLEGTMTRDEITDTDSFLFEVANLCPPLQ